jgi:hypothetical protein
MLEPNAAGVGELGGRVQGGEGAEGRRAGRREGEEEGGGRREQQGAASEGRKRRIGGTRTDVGSTHAMF